MLGRKSVKPVEDRCRRHEPRRSPCSDGTVGWGRCRWACRHHSSALLARSQVSSIAIGALKFFLLRVDPKKRMVFNPEESIDFHGFTGPFVQYTYARIKSILRKEKATGNATTADLLTKERQLIVLLEQYPSLIEQALQEHNPSILAIYSYEVAKTFSSFYTEHSVLSAETEEKKQLRLKISELTANVISSAMALLGIKVPERM